MDFGNAVQSSSLNAESARVGLARSFNDWARASLLPYGRQGHLPGTGVHSSTPVQSDGHGTNEVRCWRHPHASRIGLPLSGLASALLTSVFAYWPIEVRLPEKAVPGQRAKQMKPFRGKHLYFSSATVSGISMRPSLSSRGLGSDSQVYYIYNHIHIHIHSPIGVRSLHRAQFRICSAASGHLFLWRVLLLYELWERPMGQCATHG